MEIFQFPKLFHLGVKFSITITRDQKLFNISTPFIFIGYNSTRKTFHTSSAWKSLPNTFPMNAACVNGQNDKDDPFDEEDSNWNEFMAFVNHVRSTIQIFNREKIELTLRLLPVDPTSTMINKICQLQDIIAPDQSKIQHHNQ